MTKCICRVEISPDNVRDHQGCGTKMYDSEISLASINQMVAENKQRFIKFPYTGEVVDFLLASIDGLSEERDSFQRVGIKAMERAEKAEVLSKTLHDVNFKQAATIMSIKGARSAFWIQLADIFDLDIRDDTISLVDHIQACSDQNDTLTKENDGLRKQNAEQDALLGNPAVPIDSGGFNLVSKLSESEAENTALTEKVADLEFAMVLASVGSCNCLIKTNDHTYHANNCRYRILQQALAAAEKEK